MKRLVIILSSVLVLFFTFTFTSNAFNFISVETPSNGQSFEVNKEITIDIKTNGIKADRWSTKVDRVGVVIIKDGNEVYNETSIYDDTGQPYNAAPYGLGMIWPKKLGSTLHYKFTPTSAGTYTMNVYFATLYDYKNGNQQLVDTRTFKVVGKSNSNTSSEVAITSITPVKKGFKVTWDKAACKGYQLRYSLKKNMKSAKTKTIKKAATTSKKVTKLKAKKNIMFR